MPNGYVATAGGGQEMELNTCRLNIVQPRVKIRSRSVIFVVRWPSWISDWDNFSYF